MQSECYELKTVSMVGFHLKLVTYNLKRKLKSKVSLSCTWSYLWIDL